MKLKATITIDLFILVFDFFIIGNYVANNEFDTMFVILAIGSVLLLIEFLIGLWRYMEEK